MGMCGRLIVLLITIHFCDCQGSAQYLQNAVSDLKNNFGQTLRRAGTVLRTNSHLLAPQTKSKTIVERRAQHSEDIPPISLTKGELAALYEAAITKGETIKLDTGDDEYIHAAVHHVDEDGEAETQHMPDYSEGPPDHGEKHSDSDAEGYYYYYYPIQSFLNEIRSQSSGPSKIVSSGDSYHKPYVHHETKPKPQYQYHSHTHQHNVTIKTAPMEEKKPKAMEPLFMAISGFIGMAVMFILSVLVLPKFGIPNKTRDIHKNEKIEDFARLALQAIDGECAERFACELSKTARNFNLQENRFVKLLKRMAPGTFGRHIDKVEKYRNKQLKCTAIPCKKKKPTQKPTNQKKKTPNRKKN